MRFKNQNQLRSFVGAPIALDAVQWTEIIQFDCELSDYISCFLKIQAYGAGVTDLFFSCETGKEDAPNSGLWVPVTALDALDFATYAANEWAVADARRFVQKTPCTVASSIIELVFPVNAEMGRIVARCNSGFTVAPQISMDIYI